MNQINFTGSEQAYKALNWILSYDINDAQIPEYNQIALPYGDGAIHELLLNDYIEYKNFGGIKYIFPKEN